MEIKTPGNIGYINLTTLHLWYPLFENAGQEQLSAALLTKILETMTHILAKQRTYALACIKYTATVIIDVAARNTSRVRNHLIVMKSLVSAHQKRFL